MEVDGGRPTPEARRGSRRSRLARASGDAPGAEPPRRVRPGFIFGHLFNPFPMPRYSSIDEVIASYPDRFQPAKAQDVDDTVYMNLTGANAREVVLYVHNGELDIREGETPEDPTLRLTADADDWLKVENGELNPMMAMMQGKIKMRGSMPFAMKFMGMFGFSG